MEPVAAITRDFQKLAEKLHATCTQNLGAEAINSLAGEVLGFISENMASEQVKQLLQVISINAETLRRLKSTPEAPNALKLADIVNRLRDGKAPIIMPSAGYGMAFLEGYIEATGKGEAPSRDQQDMALCDIEAMLAAATVDPQEKLYDKELADAEKSVEVKPGTRAAIHSESHKNMVKHFIRGKEAVLIAKSLGASVDTDKVTDLKWPTQKSYQDNTPGTVKQLDDVMTCAVKGLMSQLKIKVPETDTWEGLTPELHKLLKLHPPIFPDQTRLPGYDLPRMFAVYDNDLPKWLVALALTAVTSEIDLQSLFPKAREALHTNGTKSIKPEVYDLIKGMTQKSSIPWLMSFIELVLKPNLEIAEILLN